MPDDRDRKVVAAAREPELVRRDPGAEAHQIGRGRIVAGIVDHVETIAAAEEIGVGAAAARQAVAAQAARQNFVGSVTGQHIRALASEELVNVVAEQDTGVDAGITTLGLACLPGDGKAVVLQDGDLRFPVLRDRIVGQHDIVANRGPGRIEVAAAHSVVGSRAPGHEETAGRECGHGRGHLIAGRRVRSNMELVTLRHTVGVVEACGNVDAVARGKRCAPLLEHHDEAAVRQGSHIRLPLGTRFELVDLELATEARAVGSEELAGNSLKTAVQCVRRPDREQAPVAELDNLGIELPVGCRGVDQDFAGKHGTNAVETPHIDAVGRAVLIPGFPSCDKAAVTGSDHVRAALPLARCRSDAELIAGGLPGRIEQARINAVEASVLNLRRPGH